MSSAVRRHLLERLADLALELSFGARLAIDGPDTAGKTVLGDELAALVTDGGRPVVRASIDGFHRPASERYRRGRLSPEGYYSDSFDLERLRSVLLEPLGPTGDRTYRTAVFDHVRDKPVAHPAALAPADAILIFDGVFLLRPELADVWELAIYLEVNEEEILRRAAARDGVRMGADTEERYRLRYLPAQRRYREDVRPSEIADVVIDNTDLEHPVVVKSPW